MSGLHTCAESYRPWSLPLSPMLPCAQGDDACPGLGNPGWASSDGDDEIWEEQWSEWPLLLLPRTLMGPQWEGPEQD